MAEGRLKLVSKHVFTSFVVRYFFGIFLSISARCMCEIVVYGRPVQLVCGIYELSLVIACLLFQYNSARLQVFPKPLNKCAKLITVGYIYAAQTFIFSFCFLYIEHTVRQLIQTTYEQKRIFIKTYNDFNKGLKVQ